MNKLNTTIAACAVATVLGGLSASAQTLSLQLAAANYNASTGVWTDTSGNGNNGTWSLTGGGTLPPNPTLVAGATPSGASAVDIGSGANGSFLLNSGIGFGSGYTVFAVIEPTTTTGRRALTGGSAGQALEYDIFNGKQDYLREYNFDYGQGTATVPTTSFSLLDLAVGASASAGTYNFNGTPDGTGTSTGTGFGSALTRIGNNEGGGDNFAGDISEIDIYSGVLTSGQIATEEAALTAEYITPVPEPSSWVMLAGGLGTLVAVRRFRRS
jgi:hypothetical protein